MARHGHRVVSAPAHSTPADKERHMRAQMLHWQERHAAWFDRNARKLSVHDMLSLKATTALPWSMLRAIRSFLHSRRLNVFPSEHKVRDIDWDRDIEYSTGYVPVADKPAVPYIRIVDLWKFIRVVTMARHHARSLVWWPHQDLETLSLAVHTDKGGHSTKLMLTWLNTTHPQSHRGAMVIALYEGKQNHEAMRIVFGPLLKEMGKLPRRYRLSSGGELTPSRDLVYRSGHCAECKRAGAETMPVAPEGIDITKVEFVYGADVTALHDLLGTSGHSSTYFCPCCTATLAQLQPVKGKVHAVHAVGVDKIDTIEAPPVRTLAKLIELNDQFMVDEKRGAEYGGAVRQCLITTEIAHNIVPPVLHIVAGISNGLLKKLEALCKAAGSEEKLKALMHKCSVYRTKYSGGELTGECAMRLINNAAKFAAILQPSVSVAAYKSKTVDWNDIFSGNANIIYDLFYYLHRAALLILRATPLCDHELDNLDVYVGVWARIWQATFPTARFTPKMHMLCIDTPHGTCCVYVCVCVVCACVRV